MRNWQGESLTSLAAYIIDQHHSFTKQELERLAKLTWKVSAKHGEKHPELFEVQNLFQLLKQDLIPHMLKEEQVLFPYIARLEKAMSERRAIPPPFFGTVRNPVRMMTKEHDTAGLGSSGSRKEVPRRYREPAAGFGGDLQLVHLNHLHRHLKHECSDSRSTDDDSFQKRRPTAAVSRDGQNRAFRISDYSFGRAAAERIQKTLMPLRRHH
jgi:Hemerythrin HHE cation binding domain